MSNMSGLGWRVCFFGWSFAPNMASRYVELDPKARFVVKSQRKAGRETNCWDVENVKNQRWKNEGEKQVWTKVYRKHINYLIWILKKHGGWKLKSMFFFLLTNHLISSWFRGEYLWMESYRKISVARICPYWTTWGPLSADCWLLSLSCSLQHFIHSSKTQHRFCNNHFQSSFSSNDFFCYHQIFSRVNSSHGLMDLKNRQWKSWDFKSNTEWKSIFPEVHFLQRQELAMGWGEISKEQVDSWHAHLCNALKLSILLFWSWRQDVQPGFCFVESWVKYFWI